MSAGVFINGRRPASKKAIREAIAADPASVRIENTSMFGGFDGKLTELPEGSKVDIVGPDPYTSRRFYGRISVTPKGVKLI